MGIGPKIDTSYRDFQIGEARRARRLERQREKRIDTGMQQIGEVFNPDAVQSIVDQRVQAMRDFYDPQINRQYDDAKNQLTFSLARAGLLNSTAAGEKQGDLAQRFAYNKGAIESRIASEASRTKRNIATERARIEDMLRRSADATAATNAALDSAVTFRQDTPDLNPIGNLFYGIGQGIGSLRKGYDTGRIAYLATPRPAGNVFARVVR